VAHKKLVYNLEFPSWCSELNIYGYRFTRIPDYEQTVAKLQHLVTGHSEYWKYPNTGQHCITSELEIPDREEKAVLPWSENRHTALEDVLLLLSIFTGRDLFIVDNLDHDPLLIDPRRYEWGGILRTSISFRGQPIGPGPRRYNIGFEEGLNKIYERIRSERWQQRYQNGSFLLLVESAFRRQNLETAFIQCWTIWEHLFTVLNGSWLLEDSIRQIKSIEKISFLIVEYALVGQIDKSSRKRIESLAHIRNELIHFGRFPERSQVHDDAILFIRLTEFIIAQILELQPSNVFNTMEKLEEFLNEPRNEK
jgi:hypothetical protein